MNEQDRGATALAGPVEIGCDVCTDLIPLVRDGVASEESRRLVLDHVQRCPACKHFLEQGEDASEKAQNEKAAQKNDQKVFEQVRKKFLFRQNLQRAGAALLGAGFTFFFTKYILLNLLIMPLLGGLAFWLYPKRWFWGLPMLVALVTFANFLLNARDFHLLPAVLVGAICGALALLGVLIFLLLRFAFGKETESF